MSSYDLIIDEKVSVWVRSTIKINAESLEEAVQTCINNGIGYADNIVDTKYLYETAECIEQDDFENRITIEVMDRNYNILATNEQRR